MKKIIVAAVVFFAFSACKNTEEVKVDQTRIESTGDTLTGKDTVALREIPAVVPEPATQKVSAGLQAVNGSKPAVPQKVDLADYTSFGEKFTPKNVLTPADMISKYKTLKQGDTVSVQFKSKVNEVCKKKGCWMSLDLPGDKESFVRFKDYGFFVPKNADGSEAIVSGIAYIDIVSVAELQHYAKDGGKSQQEIDEITEPKITYAFQADGVLMK